MRNYTLEPCSPLPLGTTVVENGVRFSVFSRNATAILLAIFSDPASETPVTEIVFDQNTNKTGDIWHGIVKGLRPGDLYMYRVSGPDKPDEGHQFNDAIFLLDPYAKAVTGTLKGVVVDDYFDWEGDKPLNHPLRFSVIYETHVRGLTAHPSAAVENRGTYRGLVEMIPYLQELGITSLELLPVMEFNRNENTNTNPIDSSRLINYWGYSTVAYFAPNGWYSSGGTLGGQVTEFKEMVKALHRAGIEVILDVVFNHTAEMDGSGQTYNFRGFDNSIYYILDNDKRLYKDFTGCKNTFNCNHPVVRDFILDCLHYWVVEMHVDGFRFDLASVMARDQDGNLLENPPVLERIAEDPVLRNTKIIAEAWDAAGTYQVGSFPGGRWATWNDKFRDDVRKFWRGDRGTAGRMATRITGSSDMFSGNGRKPFYSINFVTCHDGFTLNDLVSYNNKHNEINGEQQRDGSSNNLSSNYGYEGESTDPGIIVTRRKQIKNFLLCLFLANGTPMMLGGDEIMRTQQGNNNAYCQDNKVSWYNWDFLDKNREVYTFCRNLILFRRSHPAFQRATFYSGRDIDRNSLPDISWFDCEGKPYNWAGSQNILAFRIDGSKVEIESEKDDNDFYIIFNAVNKNRKVLIHPAPEEKQWYLAIDTSSQTPDDYLPPGREKVLEDQSQVLVNARSSIVLISKRNNFL
jgi:isoamylase